MELWQWVALFLGQTVFLYWVVYLGGATRLEGWRSFFLIDALAPRWSADGIRLYAFIYWWLIFAWFIIGLWWPELRLA